MCVLVARAFSRVYNLKMSTRGEMELAYLGEIVTPSKCGRMDQVTPVPPLPTRLVTFAATDTTVTAQACAYGSQPVVMSYDGDQIEVDTIDVGVEMHLVIADLNAAKDTARCLHLPALSDPRPHLAGMAHTSQWLALPPPRMARTRDPAVVGSAHWVKLMRRQKRHINIPTASDSSSGAGGDSARSSSGFPISIHGRA